MSPDRILLPGASPHTFEPTPSALRSLTGAATLLVIGHGLDDWAVRLARGAGVARLVRVDAGVALRREGGHERDPVDPHYWLSIRNGAAIARTVAAELERLAPDRAADLCGTLAVYLARLDAADWEIRRLLDGLPTRRFATFHDAFRYFADAYGLEVAAVFEPYPGREPGPRFVVAFQLLTTFHVLLALAVIASISVVGIILVNALLVIPAATAKLLAPSLRRMFVLAPIIGLSSVLAGLVASYRLDLPSGPAIVVVAGLALLTAWASVAARRAGAR